MISKADYVKLGLTCADVCKALNQELERRQTDQLSQPILEAIQQFTTYVRPAIRRPCGPLTELSIVGLWIRSRGKSSSGANEIGSFDISAERATMRRSLPGSWT